MEAIMLPPDLEASLEQEAERRDTSVNVLVSEAVRDYIDKLHMKKLEQEIDAFRAMHEELKQEYFGEWVAFHERKLVDHDADKSALLRRVRAQYSRATVLVRQVENEPERVLKWRGISLAVMV